MPRIFHIAIEVPDVSDGCGQCDFYGRVADMRGEMFDCCTACNRKIPTMSTVPEWCSAETTKENIYARL